MRSMCHLLVFLACLGNAQPVQPNSTQIQGSAGHSLIRPTRSQSGLALLLLTFDPAAAFHLTHAQSPVGGRLHGLSQVPARCPDTSMRLDRRCISNLGYDVSQMEASEVEEKADKLTFLQRKVALEAGTEEAFTGETTNGYKYDDQTPGYYVGAISGLPLFSSNEKFDSGTGWPSFTKPVDGFHVRSRDDETGRKEVVDAISGAHLGHVFSDGPGPGKLRYCMNAAALTFVPSEDGKVPKGRSKLGYDVTMMSRSELEEKAKKLNPFQRNVALDAGTEMKFTGKTTNGVPHDSKQPGYYVGAVSGLPLFSSKEKYDSGTGWPSFWAPVDERHVICRPDPKDKNNPLAQLLMGGIRTEVIDAVSGAHLGHVFPDGPRSKGGDRFCMNSAAFTFVPSEDGEVPRGGSINS